MGLGVLAVAVVALVAVVGKVGTAVVEAASHMCNTVLASSQ